MKHTSSLVAVRNVQTRLTNDEYERLDKWARDRNISLNLAVRGLIENTINKNPAMGIDTALSSDEKKIVARFLDLYRGGDPDVIRCLQALVGTLEKIPARHRK